MKTRGFWWWLDIRELFEVWGCAMLVPGVPVAMVEIIRTGFHKVLTWTDVLAAVLGVAIVCLLFPIFMFFASLTEGLYHFCVSTSLNFREKRIKAAN